MITIVCFPACSVPIPFRGLCSAPSSVLLRRMATLSLFLLLGVAGPQATFGQTLAGVPAPGEDAEFLQVFHSISSHEILGYVETMSADRYLGRLSGTPEYMEVAQWVADLLAEWGIQPAGDDGSYFQWFDMPYSEVLSAGALSVTLREGEEETVIRYSFPEDYYPGTNSDAGTATGELVYVGYSITAPELGYDDYAGMDVAGKIVVMESGVPYTGDDDDTALAWVPYAYHQFKLDNAARHGAAGVLYVGKLANPNTSFNEGLVYVHIDEHVADHLFFGTGQNRDEVLARTRDQLAPASMALNKTATITAEAIRHPEGRAANVLGLIEGSDPALKDEVIIVGGHLDAVGFLGVPFPGALDNGSGVADILGAARALAASPVKPRRSILFLFIGGEECGLIGSDVYTKNPVFPAEKTVAFFNLDMVGHGTGLRVSGAASYPRILRHFEAANQRYLHRPLSASEERISMGRPRSDGVIFQRAGFRSLGFGTSGRVEGIPTYYHDPRDTTASLTPEIMEDVAKLMFVGFTGLANDQELRF